MTRERRKKLIEHLRALDMREIADELERVPQLEGLFRHWKDEALRMQKILGIENEYTTRTVGEG